MTKTFYSSFLIRWKPEGDKLETVELTKSNLTNGGLSFLHFIILFLFLGSLLGSSLGQFLLSSVNSSCFP